MTRNPSDRVELELTKRSRVFPNTPEIIQANYWFCTNPPGADITESERHLIYVKYQPNDGVDTLATAQEFPTIEQAKRHLNYQKRYSPNVFAQASVWHLIKRQDKYVIIFSKLFRDFNGWVSRHAKGLASDADMWMILKTIGKNLRYLSTQAEWKRPHGNLRKGVGITPKVETLFYNLSVADHALMHRKDIEDLHGFLKVILPNMRDSKIRGCGERWLTFLSKSCLQVEADFTPVEDSSIYPFFNPSHVRLIVNFPGSWDLEDELLFLSRMHRLCKTEGLLRNDAFGKHLMACYPNWNECFTSGTNTGGLNLVYQKGVQKGNYVDKYTGVLCVPSIALFARNCIGHFLQAVSKYNFKNGHVKRVEIEGIVHIVEDRDHPNYVEGHLTSCEILAELEKEFPGLVENIFIAFYKAVASGYKHHFWSIEKLFSEGRNPEEI